MITNWEIWLYGFIALFGVIWYAFIFRVLRKDKHKKNTDEGANVQKSPIFASEHHFNDEGVDHLLNHIDEQQSSPELFDMFDNQKDDNVKPLIRKEHENFKVIKNDPTQNPEPRRRKKS